MAPVFLVKQEDKDRFITDFRKINESLEFGMETIPPIQLLIQYFQGYSVFSSLHLKSAYVNVLIGSQGARIGIVAQFGN